MNLRPWRLLFTGKRGGAWNMALDTVLLRAVEKDLSPPTLRLYGWDPYCVSLGYFQNPETELDPEELHARRWDFVLRPTGGRAVLHAGEITYSLIARKDKAPWCASLALSHERISRAWSFALTDFALNVENRQAGERFRAGRAAPPCFASTSRAELSHAGRKAVGSAQRRTRNAFVQHGSIPLTPEHERLVEVLRMSSAEREKHRETLRRHAVSLGEIGPFPQDVETWSRTLATAFCQDLGIETEESALSDVEVRQVQEIEEIHRVRQREFLLRVIA